MFPRRSFAPKIGPGHCNAADGLNLTDDRFRRRTMTMKDYVECSENSDADFVTEPVSHTTTTFNDRTLTLMPDAATRNRSNQRVNHDQSAEIDGRQLRQYLDSTRLDGSDDDGSSKTAGFVAKDDANQSINSSKKPCCSLLSLLQQERIECGKVSPWAPLSRLDKRSKSERKEKEAAMDDVDRRLAPPDDDGKCIQMNRSISESSLMRNNRHSPSTDADNQRDYGFSGGWRKIGDENSKDSSGRRRNAPAVGVGGRDSVKGSDSESSSGKMLREDDAILLCEEESLKGGGGRRRRQRRRREGGQNEMPAAVRRTSWVAKLGVPVAIMSEKPYTDIFRSLYEMGRHIMLEAAAEPPAAAAEVAAELEELLVYYLALNPPSLSTLIRHAFAHAVSHLLLL